jgi:diguanylate cyclase (GGDEF)-like protein/PAS domain S-box-containing protein
MIDELPPPPPGTFSEHITCDQMLRFYDTLLDSMQSGFTLHDRDARVLVCNRKAAIILGIEKASLIGQTPETLTGRIFREDRTPAAPDDFPVNVVRRTGLTVENVILGVGSLEEGIRVWISINAAPVLLGDEIDMIAVSFIDVTTMKTTMDSLRRSESNLKNILDHTPLGVCVTDEMGHFEQANDAYCKLYGYSRQELLGKHFTMIVPPEERVFMSDLHNRFIKTGTEIRGEWSVVAKDGQVKTIIADAARIVMDANKMRKVTFVMDITEKKRFEEELKQTNAQLEIQNRMDPLTRLFNRKLAMERLEILAGEFKRYGSDFCVAMIDIDHFKTVNDSFGHRAGDDVLECVAREIKAHSRETDVAARFGGEEFLLIMPHTSQQGAMSAMEKIRARIESLAMTSYRIKVTVSAGVAQYRGNGIREFIEEADKALYSAKNSGRNRVVSSLV